MLNTETIQEQTELFPSEVLEDIAAISWQDMQENDKHTYTKEIENAYISEEGAKKVYRYMCDEDEIYCPSITRLGNNGAIGNEWVNKDGKFIKRLAKWHKNQDKNDNMPDIEIHKKEAIKQNRK